MVISLQKEFGDFSLLVLYVYRHRHTDLYTNTQTFPIKTSNRNLKSITTCQSFWALIFAAKEYLLGGLSNLENIKSGNLATAGKFSFKKGWGARSLHFFFFFRKSKPAFIFKASDKMKVFKVCCRISDVCLYQMTLEKLYLKYLNTEQKRFEDEWEYHPQTLPSFLFWHLSPLKIFHFIFTFSKSISQSSLL